MPPMIMTLHIAGGCVALLTGLFQVMPQMRARYRAAHRWLGVAYVAAVLVAGTASLPVAMLSTSPVSARVGFAVLGVLWLATTTLGLAAIINRNIAAHRRWMTRSYALTLAAVTLRIYLPIAMAVGVSFETAYPAIGWLCWVPNLVVAEVWFVRVGSTRPHLREPVAWPSSRSS